MLASLIFIAAAISSARFPSPSSRASCFGLPDPHSYGSGNPGATNVLRTGNKAAAALTLVGDGAKGLVRRLARAAAGTRTSTSRTGPCPASRSRCSSVTSIRSFTASPAARAWRRRRESSLALQWPLAARARRRVADHGGRVPNLVARGAHRRRADADRHVLPDRQFARRVGDGADRRAAVLAASSQHPPAPRGQGTRDRALTRAGLRRVQRRELPARPDGERVIGGRPDARAAARRRARSSRRCRCRTRGRERTLRAPRVAASAGESRAQLAIGADAAGDDQAREAGRRRAPPAPSRPARRRPRAGTRARCRPGAAAARPAGPDSRRTSVSAAVFKPLKLMSRSPLSSIGRGSVAAPSRPASARRASAGPPG